MKIHVVPAGELSDPQVAAWRRLQRANPALASPHFSVDFVRAVAEVRSGIEVAVWDERGGPVGFLPFHRRRGNVAGAVAATFSDFQGPVCAADLDWDPRRLLPAAGLTAWRFRNLPASQRQLVPFQWQISESPYIDLAGGFEAYRDERRRAGSDELREALRKARKIERDVAPLRFEWSAADPQALQTLVRWKRQQLQARRLPDGFADDWVEPLLARIAATETEEFAGLLSVLYVGDEFAAVNLAIRWRHVVHGWVTGFNRAYARFSPGLIMVARLAEAAAARGVQRIDMGCGSESFKKSFASGVTPVAMGAVESRRLSAAWQRGWLRTQEALRGTPWEARARKIAGLLRHGRRRQSPAVR